MYLCTTHGPFLGIIQNDIGLSLPFIGFPTDQHFHKPTNNTHHCFARMYVCTQCCGSEIIFFGSNTDPALQEILDPDPTFREISDPDPTQFLRKEAKAKFKKKLKHKF